MKILLGMLALSVSVAASAERADRFEKTVIQYDGDMHYDSIKGHSRFNDNVVLTKGSLWIASDNLLVTEAADGYHTYTVTAAKGGVAKFRQKQDGADDRWINGEGKVSAHGSVTEEASSAKIVYDARTEQFFSSSIGDTAKVRSMLTINARQDPLSK